MLVQSAILLGSIPLYNPFPMILVLSTVATVAFGAELVIARLRVHPRTWLYVLLAGCVGLGAVLMAWSGYYALYGPTGAVPRFYISGIHDPWYDFYRTVWYANAAIVFLAPMLVMVFGIVLWRQKK